MKDDAHFSIDEDEMHWPRYLGFTIATTMLIDQLNAAPFLKEIAEAIPEIRNQLSPVVECYRASSELIKKARNLIADDFSSNAIERFGNSTIRKEYAELLSGIYENTRAAAQGIRTAIEEIT